MYKTTNLVGMLDVYAKAKFLEHATFRFDHLILSVIVGFINYHWFNHSICSNNQIQFKSVYS